MHIRLAQQNDLPSINEIYNQAVLERFCTAHLEPVGLDQRVRWFSGHPPGRYPVYVSHDHDRITGWVSLGPYRTDRQALAHVAEVSYYIHRSYRRQGIGSFLVQHAIRVAPSCGINILVAILLDRNTASIALLEKFGFLKWGSMPGIARIGNETADHLYYGLKL
jgi:L-amino acid N-acyltransferase YncA